MRAGWRGQQEIGGEESREGGRKQRDDETGKKERGARWQKNRPRCAREQRETRRGGRSERDEGRERFGLIGSPCFIRRCVQRCRARVGCGDGGGGGGGGDGGGGDDCGR